jgi:hypothetical protein
MNSGYVICALTLSATGAVAQSPEMTRLAQALAGDWRSVEVVQFGKPLPDGQGRRGTVQARLASGGNVLVVEGHAVGAVGGEIGWYSAFWWHPAINRYRMLTCFYAPGIRGECRLRGTAYWEGETFVNEYADSVDGKLVNMRDVWGDLKQGSYSLTELHETDQRTMSPYVVSHLTRVRVRERSHPTCTNSPSSTSCTKSPGS